MVNNYPEYAAGVNFKKTDSNNVTHFYSAQVVADPSDETIESKLIKDGVVISEGGGGGSSDLSIAKVTVILTENSTSDFYGPSVVRVGANPGSIGELELGTEEGEFNIVLYKGLYSTSTNTDTFVSVSGNATYEVDEEYGDVEISITGDCTITLNKKQMG